MQLFQGTKVFSAEVGGRTLAIETGLLAPQAGGAVTVRYGDTVLLATATMSKDVRQGINFFPLTVEFEERLYAAGRIPGSFFRREGRPSEQAILISRLVDRPLRPLFPKGMRNETQVIVTALATDAQNLMDALAIIAASAALAISDIPWSGPIAATTIGFVDGEFVVNPMADQMLKSGLNLVAAGTSDNILMVEAGANELPEDLMLEALRLAHDSNQAVIDLIVAMRLNLASRRQKSHCSCLQPS
jgi:polyribonucleotide nucleotidyltransferase